MVLAAAPLGSHTSELHSISLTPAVLLSADIPTASCTFEPLKVQVCPLIRQKHSLMRCHSRDAQLRY